MKKIALPGVTLLTVTSVDIESSLLGLLISCEHIDFGAVKLLSPQRPARLPAFVQHVPIPPINFLGYSKFMIEELHKHVDTPHCLVVQADGFVLNADRWDDAFLQYDYIGAPWPPVVGQINSPQNAFHFSVNRVGNGGFSLRSRKLLAACAEIEFDRLRYPLRSEDVVICHYLYAHMVAAGIRFAPLEVAARFALECEIDESRNDLGEVFGFHGKHWLEADRVRNAIAATRAKSVVA